MNNRSTAAQENTWMSLSLKGVYQHRVTAHNTWSILKNDKKEYNNNKMYTTGSTVQTLVITLQSSWCQLNLLQVLHISEEQTGAMFK